MNAAKLSDGLLPATSTLALVDLVRDRAGGTTQEQLIRDLAASTPISWSRAWNTVAKLLGYGVIATSSTGLIRLAGDFAENPMTLISDSIARELVGRLVKERAWGCMRLDPSGMVTIDAMTMPKMGDGLGMWVTDFEIAARDRTEARFWEVTERYRAVFISAVREANAARPKHSKSAEKLAADLARQAEMGEAAELWVLEYERNRLRNHPFQDQIRRISVDDVSAGYDIMSFAAHSSLQHDLFIEVKSYGATKAFHWSRNEIATAAEFGEEYALYLVDRTRTYQSSYSPHIISGPSPEMFALPGSGWKVEATSFEHVALLG
ncbi:DUF3883 domain-containing protein [Mesorhizobium sp. M0217]|uniref:DUF3883 domain-containing protein n=1 Tax=unclassified Mesorhizobium TaxID=325217 RepID=UPI00333CAC05